MSGNCCQITDHVFNEQDARRNLRDYRKHGAPPQTSELLSAIRSLGPARGTLLDVGGGVGIIHHELLADIAVSATHVDASSAFLSAARQEADRLGHTDRLTFIHADFTDVAADLPAADFVTLDRVVCCYPDFRSLLSAAASHARRALGIVYPREIWYTSAAIGIVNFLQHLRRDPFRVFVHPVSQMDSIIRGSGLHRTRLRRFAVWEVALYTR